MEPYNLPSEKIKDIPVNTARTSDDRSIKYELWNNAWTRMQVSHMFRIIRHIKQQIEIDGKASK